MKSTKMRLIYALMEPVNPSAVIILGLLTLLWGVWIAVPFIDAFGSASTYEIMKELMPEWIWGGLAISTGASIIAGVVKHKYRSLVYGTWIGAVFWISILIGLLLGNWQDPYWIIALGISIYCGFIYLNIRLNKDNLPFDKVVDKL